MTGPTADAPLAVLRCAACQAIAVWPRHMCVACGATGLTPSFASGGGYIHSVTLIHRPPPTEEQLMLPYAVALVALDVGGQLMARVPVESRIGDQVVAQREGVAEMPEVRLVSANR
jgi:uncharacterized OB-fold protein